MATIHEFLRNGHGDMLKKVCSMDLQQVTRYFASKFILISKHVNLPHLFD